MWEAILADAAAGGATDVVIAPMHRGRLTLITRVVGKPFNAAFAELMGTPPVPDGIAASSDVPYHLGLATDRQFGDRTLRPTMPTNPNHVKLVLAVTPCQGRAQKGPVRPD